jgi:D-amino-acid dehydrogenase
MGTKSDVVIIGGGIVGLSSAYYLQEAGYTVQVLESGDGTDGCSYGNAGFVSPSHFIPLAAPGIVGQGLRWMTNPESPFYIKPRLDLGLAKWGWNFLKNATDKNVNESKSLLTDFAIMSRKLHQEIAEAYDIALEPKGIVMLCSSKKALEHEIEIADMAIELGMEAEVWNQDQVQKNDPGLKMNAEGGVYFPYDAYADPAQFMQVLTRVVQEKGVEIHYNTEVTDFVRSNNQINEVITAKGVFKADEVVVATGSFTPRLLKKLRMNLIMEAGKGYSVDWTNPPVMPSLSYILVEARVAVTPMQSKVRLAGTMELTGIDLSINQRRVAGFLKSVEAFFPDFAYDQLKDLKPWAGLRPCSPDGLPFIGRNGKFQNVTVATGHAMLGFTLGPATGKIVAEIVAGKPTSIDINKMALDRF